MHKLLLVIPMGLLAASLIIAPGRGFAADDEGHGRQDERQDLRQDRQQLEKLGRRGKEEIREGDRGEAGERDNNSEIHGRRKDTRNLRREDRDNGREHHDEHHDND